MNDGYLAGFFDADGSVSISTYSSGTQKIQLRFDNSHLGVIECIRKHLGVEHRKIYSLKPSSKDGFPRKTMYELAISEHKLALSIMERMLPHLIVKRKRVEEAIQFVKDKKWKSDIVEEYTEKIRKLYWDEGLSCSEIGERLGKGHRNVWIKMKRAGIPRRTPKEARRLRLHKLKSESIKVSIIEEE